MNFFRPLMGLVLAGVAGACVPASESQRSGAAPQPSAAPAAQAASASLAGRELVQQKCSTCHALEVALDTRRSPAAWAEVIDIMIGHGMSATDAERRLIQRYLEAKHSSSTAR